MGDFVGVSQLAWAKGCLDQITCCTLFPVLSRLFVIKFIHSLIFWWQVACLIYIMFAGISRTFGAILLIAVASILLNGLLLLLNKGRCPFTTLAESHGAERGSVTDMFVPDCVTRNTFRVSTVVFAAELVLLAVRFIFGI